MRYVHRDVDGSIIGHYANAHAHATEEMADDDAELVAWEQARRLTGGVTVAELEAEFRAQIADLRAQIAALTGQ